MRGSSAAAENGFGFDLVEREMMVTKDGVVAMEFGEGKEGGRKLEEEGK